MGLSLHFGHAMLSPMSLMRKWSGLKAYVTQRVRLECHHTAFSYISIVSIYIYICVYMYTFAMGKSLSPLLRALLHENLCVLPEAMKRQEPKGHASERLGDLGSQDRLSRRGV